jgi:hypothetical protein
MVAEYSFVLLLVCHIIVHDAGFMLILKPTIGLHADRLQLLVLKLALQLLRLGHLPDCFVEVVLVDRISVVLDSE